MLDAAHAREDSPARREHISFALYPSQKPLWPSGWSIDSQSDYDAAVAHLEAIEDDAAAFGGRT
jgi:hypothetical protein